ncbi:MAG: hypothetical protein GF401_05080, partial [Chitinivibrionales bacterium]|nr:hypothetical protein [Chitinivibrionales bacterium]
WDYDYWELGEDNFKKYYDACVEGLAAADSHLVFGGFAGIGAVPAAIFNHIDSLLEPDKKYKYIDFVSFSLYGDARFAIQTEQDYARSLWNAHDLYQQPVMNTAYSPTLSQGKHSAFLYASSHVAATLCNCIYQRLLGFDEYGRPGQYSGPDRSLFISDNAYMYENVWGYNSQLI